jgi:predicted RND superfamily exporter protein
MTHWAAWPARHPRAALAIALALTAISVLAVLRIRPDASLERMMSKDDPAARAAVRVLNAFPAAEELLVLATLPDDRDGADVEALLAFARRLEQGVHESPDASRWCAAVQYRADAQIRDYFEKVLVPNGLYYLDDESFAAARARLTRAGMLEQFRRDEAMVAMPGPAAAAMAKVFIQDPLRLHEFVLDRLMGSRPFKTYGNSDALVSQDGRSILIRIPGRRPPSDLQAAKAMTAAVTDLAARANTGGLRVDVSGAYAIAAASERAIRADMTSSVMSSVAFLAGLFLLAYRRPLRLLVLGYVPVGVGVLYGFAAYSGFSSVITPLTAVIGGILAGMGIDYSIHYLAHYQTSRSLGYGAAEAAAHTTRSIGPALLAAWATSVVGFVTIGWSRVQALRDFALLGSLGLTGAFLGSVFVLPAMLAWRDRRAGQTAKVPTPRFDLAPALRWIRSRRALCVGISTALTGVAVCAIVARGGRPQFESEMSVMHPQPNPSLEAQKRIAERMGGSPGSLIVYLKATSPAELLATAHRVRERLATPGPRGAGVSGAYGLATLLPDPAVARSRRAAVAPAEVDRVIADFRDVVAQSAFRPDAFEPYVGFLRHLLTRSEPPGLGDVLSRPELAKTVLAEDAVAGRDPPTEAMTLVFLDRSIDDAAARAQAVSAIRAALADVPGATLTGLNVISHDMQTAIHADLPRLTLASIAVVLVYLVVQLRSLRDPLLALVPTVFSLTLTLAVLHLAGVKINMINLVTIPLLIGMTVDYGVFVVHLARLRAAEPPDVFEAQLASSCHAILMCGLTTVLGFGSLAFTSVPAVRSLGIAVGVGVITCLVGTLLCLLPLVAPAAVELPRADDPARADTDAARGEVPARG